jgi:hypothetical protein
MLGRSKDSFEDLGRFMSLIFEICNIHHMVMQTTRRTLSVMIVNNKGENVFPNIDYCDEIRMIRERLHQIYKNSNETALKNIYCTGFTISDFKIGERVWFFDEEGKTIQFGELRTIFHEEKKLSVRSSTKKTYRLLPSLAIPFIKIGSRHPSMQDFNINHMKLDDLFLKPKEEELYVNLPKKKTSFMT